MHEMTTMLYSRWMEEKDRLLLHWRDYSPIYKMYLVSSIIQIKAWIMMYYVEMLYFVILGIFIYFIFENFVLHLENKKDQLNLQKKMNKLEEENKNIKNIWGQKINEEEYRSESNYHKGIRNLQIQYDELFAKMEHTMMQMDQLREKMNKDDEWRGRARGYFRANRDGFETLQKCLAVQEDVNGGFRNEIRIIKGRITKLRTHVDKHLYDEDNDDDYVEVSE